MFGVRLPDRDLSPPPLLQLHREGFHSDRGHYFLGRGFRHGNCFKEVLGPFWGTLRCVLHGCLSNQEKDPSKNAYEKKSYVVVVGGDSLDEKMFDEKKTGDL